MEIPVREKGHESEIVSHVRIIRETDQRYNRTCSRYAFVPASPTCLRDVDPASKSARSVLRISRAHVDDTRH